MKPLLNQNKLNDQKWFELLYEEYSQKLYFFLYRYTNSAYLSEEVTQLTFIKLWEGRSKISDSFALSTQVYKTAKNILIDRLRHEQRQKILAANNEILMSESEDGEQILIDKSSLKDLELKIETLPPVRKKIFKLSRYEGASYKEIAQALSLSPKTVENQIALALKELKLLLSLLFILLIK